MQKVRCHCLLLATIPPKKEILLACLPQTIFKAVAIEATADVEGVGLFLSGRRFDIPPATKKTIVPFKLDGTIHSATVHLGEMVVFHLYNPNEVESSVILKVQGYGVDVEPESCIHDPTEPIVADIRPRGLQKPVQQVLNTIQVVNAIATGPQPEPSGFTDSHLKDTDPKQTKH